MPKTIKINKTISAKIIPSFSALILKAILQMSIHVLSKLKLPIIDIMLRRDKRNPEL
jgi:hypothetical protein